MQAKDPINEYLPTKGLFADYIKFTSGSEICPRFRFFSIAAALGSLIKRNIWFQRSSSNLFPTIFPNIWIILVAPQGVGHKSSALSAAKKLIQKLDDKFKPRVMASKLTPEALVKALACQEVTPEVSAQLNNDPKLLHVVKKKADGLLYASELGVLIGREKYNQGMIPLLTDLYDCPEDWYSETVMRGDQRLYDVCLSVMAASTPDWMQSMLPADVFKGGFMSRLMIIGYPEGYRLRISDPPPGCKQLESSLLDQLTKIASTKGEIRWDKSAKKFFDEWYCGLPEPDPGPKSAYLERKQDQLLRLAILIEISQNTDLILTKDSLNAALDILNCIELDTLRMIDYIATEPRMRVVQRVFEYIEAKKTVAESELLANTWKYLSRPQEFNDVMELLLKTKEVTMRLRDGETIYTLVDKYK